MRCAEFETRLNDLLDSRLRPDADSLLCAHARKCPACGELLYAQELLFEVLDAQPRPDSASDLAARVLVDLEANAPPARVAAPREKRRVNARSFVWASAASLLVAAGIIWTLNRPGAPGGPAVALQGASGQHASSLPTLPLSLQNSAYFDLMRDAMSEVPTVVDDVATPFRPLATSMGAAFNALRNSLPNLRNAG
jgi:hypothetical protein